MKKKIRNLNKLFMFGIIFMLFSCEKDLYEEGLKESGKSIIQKVNLEQIPIIKQSIENKKSKISLTSKENASIYLDLINAESINVLTQSDGLKSYTFSLDIEETNLMTNLVIQETSNDLEYYLIKYSSENIDQWKSDLINKVVSEIIPSIDFQELDAPIINLTQNKICTVVDTYWVCPSGYHHWGEQGICDYGFEEWILQTTFTDLSCGGTISGSSNPNPGGGAAIDNIGAKKECKKINDQQIKFPTLKPALTTLSSTVSQNHENGIFIDNTATATTANPINNIPNSVSVGGSISLNMNPTNQYVMIAHTHDASGSDGNGTYSIFSWDDLAVINTLIQTNHIDSDNFVFYLITADGTKYALTVNDTNSLQSFLNYISPIVGTSVNIDALLNTEKICNQYYKSINAKIKKNTAPADDLKNFLEMIQTNNMGLSLFEIDSNFSNPQRLSLSSNGIVSKQPCQ